MVTKKPNCGKLISELDTACGMLIVMAMKDPIVRKAMEKINKVSLKLAEYADDE